MNKTILILAIVTAFLIGTSMSFVLSDYEAEAQDPKPPKPPKPPKEVIVANTDPIPVTGIVTSPTQLSTLGINGIIILDGCTSLDAFIVQWFGTSPVQFAGGLRGWITEADVTETSFVAKGIYDVIQPGCAVGSRELPHVFTLTGDCGEGVTIDVTTDGGASGIIIGNVACIP